jgi:hypothetical protein
MKPLHLAAALLSATFTLLTGATSAEAATSLSSLSNSCWTTEQPFTLVENAFAKLTWDVYGNLTLVNHGGDGSKISWGLDSPVPLTGANAGKLCFGNGAGRLRIHDSSGTAVWNSGVTPENPSVYSAPNGVLSINRCTIQIKDTSGVVRWEEKTKRCDLQRSTPATNRCWAPGTTTTILRDDDADRELLWQNGRLWLKSEDQLTPVTDAYGSVQQLCHQSDNNLVIYAQDGSPLWAMDSAVAQTGVNMAFNGCGVELSRNTTPPGQSTAHRMIFHRKSLGQSCELPSSIKRGWCMATSAAGPILETEKTRLSFLADGKLSMSDKQNNELWSQGGGSDPAQYACFQNDGNLVLYRGDWSARWASSQKFWGVGRDLWLILSENNLLIHDNDLREDCKKPEAAFAGSALFQHCVTGLLNGRDPAQTWRVTGATPAESLIGGGFSYVKQLRSGNRDFGASLWLVAGALNAAGLEQFRGRVASTQANEEVSQALPTSAPPSNYVQAVADVGTSVTLFGATIKVAEGLGSIAINDGPKENFRAMVLGATVYKKETEGVFEWEKSQTFVEREYMIPVGGIPVVMKFEVSGKVGLKGNADYNPNSSELSCQVTPFMSIDGEGSIGVGVTGFSLGVEGELQFVQVAFPLTKKINTSNLQYRFTSDLDVSTLEGSLSLYAKAWTFKAKKEIAAFDGFSTSTRLTSVVGTFAPPL